MQWLFVGSVVALSCLLGACDSKTAGETSAAASLKVAPPKPPPGGPIPIPYPNVAAEKNAAPTSSAKISGKEIGLKNGSKYQKTTGD